ncbi:MAG: GTPase [Pseudomonadota bacterium]
MDGNERYEQWKADALKNIETLKSLAEKTNYFGDLPAFHDKIMTNLKHVESSLLENEYFLCIGGEVNAGKSTLLNALVGRKVASVSLMPDTTALSIIGAVCSASKPLGEDDALVRFVDTKDWSATVEEAERLKPEANVLPIEKKDWVDKALDLHESLNDGSLDSVEALNKTIESAKFGPSRFVCGKIVPLALSESDRNTWGLELGPGRLPGGQELIVQKVTAEQLPLFTSRQSPLSWLVDDLRFSVRHPWSNLDSFLVDTPGTNDTGWNDERTRKALVDPRTRVIILVLDPTKALGMAGKRFLQGVFLSGKGAFDRLFFVLNFRSDHGPDAATAKTIFQKFAETSLKAAFADLCFAATAADTKLQTYALGQIKGDQNIFCVNAKAACERPDDETTGFPQFKRALDDFLKSDEKRKAFVGVEDRRIRAAAEELLTKAATEKSAVSLKKQKKEMEEILNEQSHVIDELTLTMDKRKIAFHKAAAIAQNKFKDAVKNVDFKIRLKAGVAAAINECWQTGEANVWGLMRDAVAGLLHRDTPTMRAIVAALERKTGSIIQYQLQNAWDAYAKALGDYVTEDAEKLEKEIQTSWELIIKGTPLHGGPESLPVPVVPHVAALVAGIAAAITAAITSTMVSVAVPYFVVFTTYVFNPVALAATIAAAILALVGVLGPITFMRGPKQRLIDHLSGLYSFDSPSNSMPEGGILYKMWNGSSDFPKEFQTGLAGLTARARDDYWTQVAAAYNTAFKAKKNELDVSLENLKRNEKETAERQAHFQCIHDSLCKLLGLPVAQPVPAGKAPKPKPGVAVDAKGRTIVPVKRR